jgi:hypothetical protein
MPLQSHYIKQKRGRLEVRRCIDDGIVKLFNNNLKGRMSAFEMCSRLCNEHADKVYWQLRNFIKVDLVPKLDEPQTERIVNFSRPQCS